MIDSLIAAGGTLLSGFLNNQAADSRQDDAQEFSAQQYASRYQTTVKDLQAAGLSPMLAYGQGAGTAPSSSAASSAGYGDLGASYTQSKLASAQVANIQADTENKQAQADLIQAQVAQTRASAGSLEASTNLTNETVTKVRQEVENLKTDQQRVTAVIDNLRIEYDNLVKQGYNLTEVGNQLRASIAKMKAEIPYINSQTFARELEARLIGMDVQSSENLNRRELSQIKTIIDVLRAFKR